MDRLSIAKTINPTLEKIDTLSRQCDCIVQQKNSPLDGKVLILKKEGFAISFNLTFNDFIHDQRVPDVFDSFFDKGQLKTANEVYRFRPQSLDSMKYSPSQSSFNGKINSLIEGNEENYDETFLRYVQPVFQSPNIGLISKAADLITDQGIRYAVGILNLKLLDQSFEVFRISRGDEEFIVIDSVQRMSIKVFEKTVDAFFEAYSYIWGNTCGDEGYILTSSESSFSSINKVAFFSKPKSTHHSYQILDPHEIRKYEFHDKLFLFPLEYLENLCNRILQEEKFKRVLKIVREANLNAYPLSRCILFSASLEAISSLIDINNGAVPIDSQRFNESSITRLLTQVVEGNCVLSDQGKQFLIEKKLHNLNKPTNIDRLALAFKQFDIDLSDKFKCALAYRDKYLHGSVPKRDKLGSFNDDNNNRAFELQFLVNVLILKLIGYRGFIRNHSVFMEFFSQRAKGVNEEDIEINHSLYYKI